MEEFYHPEKYKVKFCSTYPDRTETCEYGEMCSFAHSEAELTVDLLHLVEERDHDFYMFHFKTVWCPFSDMNHARDVCVYAHNWQDYRRKPHLYDYEREHCPSWIMKTFVQNYALDGCKNEYRCRCAHGWKEAEYHPLNYKIHVCRSSEASCQKPHCPYYHSEQDRRHPVPPEFRVFPRNRAGLSTSHTVSSVFSGLYLNQLFSL